MTNILLINTNCSWNKGSAAQVISTTDTLRRLIPAAAFTLVSSIPELDSELCAIHNIKVTSLTSRMQFLRHPRLLKLFALLHYLFRSALWFALSKIRLNAYNLLDAETLTEYARADVIVDLSGDTFSDRNALSLFNMLGIFIGKFLGKKIAVFSQSIGPFGKATKLMAKFCLNAVDLIVIRDEITRNYLIDMGVSNPSAYLAAEIAFLLEPAPSEKVEEIFLKENINPSEVNSPLIGLGTSELISKAFKSESATYLDLMAKVADYLVEKLNAHVVFISHVIIPPNYGPCDDRFVAEEIHKLVKNKSRIKTVKGDYSPEELKGIIGKCDLFIGARMHSNIASTSMGVPTVALSWSHKYGGIMKMLEQEEYVCDILTATFEELVSRIDLAWSNRDIIKEKLASKTAEMEESAVSSCRLIELLTEPMPSNDYTQKL
jgi:colanic acid/amylovoran biosynthesis protein